MNAKQVVQLFKALMQGPASRVDLAERTGVQPKTIGRLLTELKDQKMVYVIDYSNSADGRNRVKLYALGDGEDAQPKDTQPQEVRSRRSYMKKVQSKNSFTPMTTFAGGKSLWH